MNAHVYEQITERITTLLAQGTVPWQKPWKARTGLPGTSSLKSRIVASMFSCCWP